jgi:hypothetical protein
VGAAGHGAPPHPRRRPHTRGIVYNTYVVDSIDMYR